MTQSLSNQTKTKWLTSYAPDEFTVLPRPVYPRSSEMPPFRHVAKHQHLWPQLAYSSNGVLHIETPGARFVLPPEQALWIPANTEHELYCRYGGSFRSVYIDHQWTLGIGDTPKSLTVDTLFRALLLEVCSWPVDYPLTQENNSLLRVFVDRLRLAPSNELFLPKSDDKRLLPIIETLMTQPANKLTLEDWGHSVGASSRTLNRLFNKSFGIGFSAWRQKLRILISLEKIDSGLPINQIASDLGYESASAFISAFKSLMGYSPGKYLNQPD